MTKSIVLLKFGDPIDTSAKAKKFDDTGVFGIGSDEMTKEEFDC